MMATRNAWAARIRRSQERRFPATSLQSAVIRSEFLEGRAQSARAIPLLELARSVLGHRVQRIRARLPLVLFLFQWSKPYLRFVQEEYRNWGPDLCCSLVASQQVAVVKIPCAPMEEREN